LSNFVLLHGGAAGAWIWKDVNTLLQQNGHNVLAVTFTGCADRRHLNSKDITQETHATDVVNAIEFAELSDVVLVGHSYSGTVIPAVLREIPEKIKQVIYVDALVLNTGESVAEAMGFMPAEQCAAVRGMIQQGQAPISSGVADQQRAQAKDAPFVMTPAQQEWMLSLLSEFPASCTVSQVSCGAESITHPIEYIACTKSDVASQHDRARALNWSISEIEGDHAVMVGNSKGTAELLESLSAKV
jgi:pimeloyl-ACP methyl ester carboxylesterase